MTGVPLAIVDDMESKGDPWQRPAFIQGSEHPVLDSDESLLVRIADCAILLETRPDPAQLWQAIWRSGRPGQATVTDRRVVVGCRRYGMGANRWRSARDVMVGLGYSAVRHTTWYRPSGKILGGHFRYEWVTDVALALGRTGSTSHLILTAQEPTIGDVTGRQWRLSVGSLAATSYLPDLVVVVANEVASAHHSGSGLDVDSDPEHGQAAGWPGLRPPVGGTGGAHIPGACPLGARPATAGWRAWRA